MNTGFIPNDSAFARHHEGYIRTYAPVGTPEEDLVRTMAENYWRLQRAHAMENALFDRFAAEATGQQPPANAHADAWADPAKGLQRLALYAARIQRAIEKTTAELKLMQSQRKAAYAKAQEEAILLTKLAAAKGNSFDPAHHFGPPESHGGFVYSPDEIRRLIVRQDRLDEARAQ